jgi:hypothetical protein
MSDDLEILGEGMTDRQRELLKDLSGLVDDSLDQFSGGFAVDVEQRMVGIVQKWLPEEGE